MLLFGPDFLSQLARLALVARQKVRGRNRAERKSPRAGRSLEFADHRTYTPGDDLRDLDWNIYGRLGRLFVKLHEEEEDLPVTLLVDASASMRWLPDGQNPDAPNAPPSKFDAARRLAAAVAHLALTGLDRAEIGWFGATLGPSSGFVRGRARTPALLDFLLRPPPAESAPTDFARSLRTLARRPRARGITFILSDFLSPAGYAAGLDALRHQRGELRLLHLLHPAELSPELSPELSGELRLHDSETGSRLDLAPTPEILRRYQAALRSFCDTLDTYARQHALPLARLSTDLPLPTATLALLRQKNFLR